MSTAWWVAIAAATATAINQLVPVWPFQAVLPHLRFRHGFMETETSTTVATTISAGGALALGLTYRMFDSFGFSNVAVSTAVVTTGAWNLGFKFGLPVVAVVLLAITGQSTGRAVGAALIGVPLSRPGARFRCCHRPVSALEEQWNGEWRYLEFLQVTSLITADIFMREIPGGTRARHRSRPVDLPEHRY
jgi:hypothetical protein